MMESIGSLFEAVFYLRRSELKALLSSPAALNSESGLPSQLRRSDGQHDAATDAASPQSAGACDKCTQQYQSGSGAAQMSGPVSYERTVIRGGASLAFVLRVLIDSSGVA